MYSANPGHILYQVGTNLSAQLEAIRDHDPDLLMDLQEDLLSLVSPVLKPENLDAWDAMGADLTEHSTDQDLFKVAMQRKRFLLPILAENGLYSRTPSKIGDASSLALDDEEDMDEP
jgi:hypothetical protein